MSTEGTIELRRAPRTFREMHTQCKTCKHPFHDHFNPDDECWCGCKRFRSENYCERCGAVADRLYPVYHVHCHDDTPHKYDEQYCGKKIMVCRGCDWEITNGRGEPDEDAGEIWQGRREQAYIDDPVNNPPPRWMK